MKTFKSLSLKVKGSYGAILKFMILNMYICDIFQGSYQQLLLHISLLCHFKIFVYNLTQHNTDLINQKIGAVANNKNKFISSKKHFYIMYTTQVT